MLMYLSETFIALIPKCANVVIANHLRPIRLYHLAYKIIANCLNPFMDHFIARN